MMALQAGMAECATVIPEFTLPSIQRSAHSQSGNTRSLNCALLAIIKTPIPGLF